MNATAFGQCLIHDENCIHYSEQQDIRCLQCLQNAPLKDSIIATRDSSIVILSAFVDVAEVALKTESEQHTATKEELRDMRKKRRRAFLWGGLGAAVIETAVIILILK